MSCSPHSIAHAHVRQLSWALLLALAYMAAEVVGGWYTGSLALLADAGHMLSDAGSLLLSLLAAVLVTRPTSSQQTFGLFRVEILAATINGALLIVVAGGIAWEAWERFEEPREIHTLGMAVIGLGGLAVNLVMLKLLHAGHEHNLNLRGAWLHVMGDTLGSVGVVIAAGGIAAGWLWADPVVSLVIAVLVLASAWRLLREAIGILMEHSPREIDVDDVRAALSAHEGVAGVHCLHVWSIASGFHAISAHVALQSGRDASRDLGPIREDLQRRFRVNHITLQLEPAGFGGCDEAPGAGCRPDPLP